MTFSGELTVWVIFCFIGVVTASLSYRYAYLNHHAAIARHGSPDLVEGTGHFQEQALCLAVFWIGFLVAGVVASIDTPPERPLGVSVFGMILRWTLIGALGDLSYMTAKNYLYGRRRWLQIRVERIPEP